MVPALLWEADPTATYITLNQRWSEYTGQTTEETQNWGWLTAIHPDDLPRAEHTFRQAFYTGQEIEFEQRIRSAGGEYRWFQVRHRPVRNEAGTITKWFGAALTCTSASTERRTSAFLAKTSRP